MREVHLADERANRAVGLRDTAALRWMGEEEHRHWVIVRGTVLSESLGNRIEYASCERGEFIVDLNVPVGSRVIEREQFYRSRRGAVTTSHGPMLRKLTSVPARAGVQSLLRQSSSRIR